MLKSTQNKNRLVSATSSAADRIDLVCAADDAYVMPLAVTLKSACRSLNVKSYLRLFLLDGGISNESWVGLQETLADEPIEINVIQPDGSLFQDLSISHHISHTAYFRLLSAELLPSDVKKVIYLDSDLFVRGDIRELWDLPLGDHYCLATVDIACPYIDAKQGCDNFRLANPYMAVFRPVRNYRELGLDGSHEYFNSGVMVLNLERWRKDGVAESLLRTLRDNQKYVWCWDQYALNVVFHGNWGSFAPRWNQGAHVFEYPSAKHAPIDPVLWSEMKSDPAIVHFTTEFKPWQYNSNHPRGEIFYEGLADTAWTGWTPEKPDFNFRRWFDLKMVSLFKTATISSRKVASFWA